MQRFRSGLSLSSFQINVHAQLLFDRVSYPLVYRECIHTCSNVLAYAINSSVTRNCHDGLVVLGDAGELVEKGRCSGVTEAHGSGQLPRSPLAVQYLRYLRTAVFPEPVTHRDITTWPARRITVSHRGHGNFLRLIFLQPSW